MLSNPINNLSKVMAYQRLLRMHIRTVLYREIEQLHAAIKQLYTLIEQRHTEIEQSYAAIEQICTYICTPIEQLHIVIAQLHTVWTSMLLVHISLQLLMQHCHGNWQMPTTFQMQAVFDTSLVWGAM